VTYLFITMNQTEHDRIREWNDHDDRSKDKYALLGGLVTTIDDSCTYSECQGVSYLRVWTMKRSDVKIDQIEVEVKLMLCICIGIL
jgi:hypothetical protein